MMNALALGLVLTSLLTAGFFTPAPEKQVQPNDDVIVKEGRRVVVVEYEKDDGNTKVSISPPDSESIDDQGVAEIASKSKEKLEEKVASKSKEKLEEKVEDVKFNPRELVCDMYGKCKHKIASVIGKAADTAAEKAHTAAEKGEEMGEAVAGKVKEGKDVAGDYVTRGKEEASRRMEGAKEEASRRMEGGKEKATGIKEEASRRMEGAKETVYEKAGEMKGEASRRMEGAKETVAETAGEMKEKASRRMEGAKERVYEKAGEMKEVASRRMEGAKEKMAEKAGEMKEEASRRMEGAKEKAYEMKEEASRTIEEAKKEGQKELTEIMRHARDVAAEVYNYTFTTTAAVTGVLHLLGFAAAYGMCVWVTFASSHVLAGALPRQQFAVVQSRIYPLYFKAMAYSVGLALVGHLMSPRRIVGLFRGFDLVAAMVMVLVNLMYLEPRATKVMHERMKMEKEEGTRKESHETEASRRAPDSTAETAGRVATERGKRDEAAAKTRLMQLSLTLQRLNSYSSFLNVMTLVSLTWHLVSLGSRLHAVC